MCSDTIVRRFKMTFLEEPAKFEVSGRLGTFTPLEKAHFYGHHETLPNCSVLHVTKVPVCHTQCRQRRAQIQASFVMVEWAHSAGLAMSSSIRQFVYIPTWLWLTSQRERTDQPTKRPKCMDSPEMSPKASFIIHCFKRGSSYFYTFLRGIGWCFIVRIKCIHNINTNT